MWEVLIPAIREMLHSHDLADAIVYGAINLLIVAVIMTAWWNFVSKAGYPRWHVIWPLLPIGWGLAALILMLRRWPAQWELIRYRIKAGAAAADDARAILGAKISDVGSVEELFALYDLIAAQFAGTELEQEAHAARKDLQAQLARSQGLA